MDDKTTVAPAQNEAEMTQKLAQATKIVETDQNQRRERAVKGSHLLPAMQAKPTELGLTVDDTTGFLKITGSAKGRRVYVAKKGGRVDISGFEIASAAFKAVSEEEAKAKHLGKVRGQLDFTKSDDEVLEAYGLALAELNAAAATTEEKK